MGITLVAEHRLKKELYSHGNNQFFIFQKSFKNPDKKSACV